MHPTFNTTVQNILSILIIAPDVLISLVAYGLINGRAGLWILKYFAVVFCVFPNLSYLKPRIFFTVKLKVTENFVFYVSA